mgnify:CR=1 FL=1
MIPQRDSFLIFGAPRIEQEEIDEVVRVLQSGWIGTGPRVAAFEEAFAAYKQMPYAAAVSSCTAALHLSMLACKLGPGAEVLVPAMTFCATANAVIHAGARPVAVDVDPASMNMDPEDARRKITKKTRAMIPVHFAGRACAMDALVALAQEHHLRVVEDCAHAIETEYHGRKAGTMGDFGCFSFYVTKNVVTGEGGMILTRDASKIERIKILGLHGMTKDAWKRFSDEGFKHYRVVECGFKDNMTDMQAALGLHQLKRVEAWWKQRQRIWNRYQEAFRELPLGLPAEPEPGTKHAHHLYTILVDEKRAGLSRDRFIDELTRRKIGVGVHYLSLTDHPYYQETLGWSEKTAPAATQIGHQTVSLPISAKLSEQDVEDVIVAVKDVLACA